MKTERSLFRRAALIVAAGLLVFQVAAGIVLFTNVLMPLAERSADDFAALLVLSARTWVELPPGTRPAFVSELAANHGLELEEAPQKRGREEVWHHPYLNFLRASLAERMEPGSVARITEEPQGRFHADIPVAGRVMRFSFSKDLVTPRPLRALWWSLAITLLVALVTAWVLARRVAGPVARLAKAARQIGAGERPGRLPESGDRELADLARVFNETADQLAAQRENQATLLAGVSHDLRSPLARLKMALGILAEERTSPLIARMETDIAEMDALIGAQLEFARARERGDSRDTDIDDLLAGRVEAASSIAPGEVHLRTTGDRCRANVAPLALQRILDNLLDNALGHGGATRVDVVRRRCRKAILVGVRDRGPGIPAEHRDAVFRPFFRLEPSRSRATGGSGLGLAIALQLADTHGWRLAIKARRGGGTSVWLVIGRP